MLPTVVENRRFHRAPPPERFVNNRKLMILMIVLVITCFNVYFKDRNKLKPLKVEKTNGGPKSPVDERLVSLPVVAREVLSDWVDTRDEFEMNGIGPSLNRAVDKEMHSHPAEDVVEDKAITQAEPLDDFDAKPEEQVRSKINRSAIKTLNQFVDNFNVYRIRTLLQAVHVPIFLPTERKPTTTTTTTRAPRRVYKPPKPTIEPKTPTKTQTIKESKTNKSSKDVETKNKNKEPAVHILPKAPVIIPLLEAKKNDCIDPAYEEFPPDLFGHWARAHGAIIFHILIVCYMFYCLAVVCDHYFLPSLEECVHRLGLSQDVAGATFMAAGSSAPELFTALLGVFIAKGDVGTGTIVGSAVFNILFVIGICSLCTVSTQLNWWPVARDSSYYTFTVLVLILFIYDGEVTTFESFCLLVLYGVYIAIMNYNVQLRDLVQLWWQAHFPPAADAVDNDTNLDELSQPKRAQQAVHYSSFHEGWGGGGGGYGAINSDNNNGNPFVSDAPAVQNPFVVRRPKVTIYEAAHQVILMHKRLFTPKTRFRHAAYLIIVRIRKARETGAEFDLSRKMSKIGLDENSWRRIPIPSTDGYGECVKWAVVAPLHAALFHTIPDCKQRPHLFLVTFFVSITWTAFFSYIMVWMVTLIGFTFGIPDSIMGITFLAAGTSIPDAYASVHVAKLGQADMAVSNSIGSNVFDILIGLGLPWFIETAIVSPGDVSTINSQGLIYAVFLLFLSLLGTIFLFHHYKWTLNPQLGRALLFTYGVFVILCSALEFNMFGYVNPPICGE